jgi:hypothetical protein
MVPEVRVVKTEEDSPQRHRGHRAEEDREEEFRQDLQDEQEVFIPV